jgi:hypothetical protein
MIRGVIGAFEDPRALVAAARGVRTLGYSDFDVYMPYAVPELDEALGIQRTKLRWWVLAMGLAGVVIAFLVQWWCNAIDYPYLVGGRPYDSLPTDVPIMFETGILFAGTTAFIAALVLSRMPRLLSPILDVSEFWRTSVDRFWLVVHHADPERTNELVRHLEELGAAEVREAGSAP